MTCEQTEVSNLRQIKRILLQTTENILWQFPKYVLHNMFMETILWIPYYIIEDIIMKM